VGCEEGGGEGDVRGGVWGDVGWGGRGGEGVPCIISVGGNMWIMCVA
jgi:hypothetical protein